MAETQALDAREQTRVMEKRFKDTVSDLRGAIKVTSDPRARALFETAAEVISGLEKAFHDYDKRDELAWSDRLPIRALATDYDGTLARHGVVNDSTLEALRRLKASGRKLIMVTGRELPDLKRVFPRLDLFDSVIVENGALMYAPDRDEERLLADAAPPALVEGLRRLGVDPLAVGRSIVATSSDHAADVEALIEQLGLRWRTILNKDSVMCLPDGVDKASGLAAALADLGVAARDVVGVGDAENDLVFVIACGVAAAVTNALPDLKAAADIVTEGEDGDGVAWLIDRLMAGQLDDLAGRRLANA